MNGIKIRKKIKSEYEKKANESAAGNKKGAGLSKAIDG